MKNLKKTTAALLAAILSFGGLVGLDTVYANLQTPVSDMKIEDLSLVGRTDYKLNLLWTKPKMSTAVDTAALDGDAAHEPLGYNIFYRNMTLSESYKTQPDAQVLAPNTAWTQTFTTLNSGSVYSFKVEPYHAHTYKRTVNGVEQNYSANAPLDSGAPKTNEALYLTDIAVKAAGLGNNITVTWDRPLINGADIFNGYKIYYALGGTSLSAVLTDNSVTVYKDNPGLKIIDGKYNYTFQGTNLVPGKLYALKIEPLYNNALIREALDNTVVIGKADYKLSFTQREYRTNDLYISPSLYVEPVDTENVRLFWDSLLQSSLDITSLKIEKSLSPLMSQPETVLTLVGKNIANSINMTYAPRPAVITYYQMTVHYTELVNGVLTEKSMKSVIAVFDPALSQFSPTKPDILDVTNNGSIPLKLNITWLAFSRLPYNDAERSLLKAGETEIIDKGVSYDIWVTDDMLNFSDPAFLNQQAVTGLNAVSLREFLFSYKINSDTFNKYAYSYETGYYTRWNGSAYERLPITDNKIYYIKIVANRTQGSQKSLPAYYSHFVPPVGDIVTTPIMIMRPPLAVKKDALGIDVITKDSITAEWEKVWYELYDKTTDAWYSKVGVKGGALFFGEDIDEKAMTVVELRASLFGSVQADGILTVKSKLLSLGVSADTLSHYTVRYMNLGDAKYEINVAEYDFLQQRGGYDSYLASLTNGDYTEINPAVNGSKIEYKVAATTTPGKSALKPDTAYVILVRPFVVVNGVKLTAKYPAYIVATTLSDRGSVDITPTVPMLIAVGSTDTSVTVKWKYSEGLDYELYYHDQLSKYPKDGILINPADVKKDGVLSLSGSDEYMSFTIPKLFPETTYNVWIRAKANNSAGMAYSEYSNPVALTTKPIVAPLTPVGLGLASMAHVEQYNKENKTELLPSESDYLILEWYKDIADTMALTGTGKPGGGAADLLLSPAINDTVMAKFNKLTANKGYYFRVKARLTVTKTADGIASYYQYILQMSPDDTFVDNLEFVVPQALNGLDPVYTKSAESPWSAPVRLFTSKYKGEYDGDKNPDMYPLPVKDFETVYDRYTDTLMLRFLSNKTDAYGNKDNMADQRFISSLIASGIYDYNVNLAYYNGKAVTNRTLELPYSIAKAFAERKITLTVTTATSVFKLAPGFYDTAQAGAVKNLGANSYITLTLNNSTAGLPLLNANVQSYVSPAQKLGIIVESPTKSIGLAYTKAPTNVAMTVTNRYLVIDKNVGTYSYTPDGSGWTRNNDSYDKASNTFKFSTSRVTAFAAISNNAPSAIGTPASEDLYEVSSRMNFKDLGHYDPKAAVPALYLNKVMAAVASGSKEVSVKTELSDAEYNSLLKSGLLVTGGNVLRETAIASLVKLYEIKTKSQIKNFGTIADSGYSDIASASEANRVPLLKAAQIGFLEGSSSRPKANLTMEEMLRMINVIMQESGM